MYLVKKILVQYGGGMLLLLFHHNFFDPSFFDGYTVIYNPFNANQIVNLALYGKICVSLFAFISGYGLILNYRNYINKNSFNNKSVEKWIIKREVKLLSPYWFIVFFSMIITQLISNRVFFVYFKNKDTIVGFTEFLATFLGLNNILKMDILVSTWWYMSAAVIFVLLIPLLAKSIDNFGYLVTISLICLIPRLLLFKAGAYQGAVGVITFIPPMVLGIYFAESSIMEQFLTYTYIKMKNIKFSYSITFIIDTVVLAASYIVYSHLPNSLLWEFKWGLLPIIPLIYLRKYFIKIPLLYSILIYLGKHTTNIFLTHTYIRAIYLKDFTYSLKYFVLIMAFVLFSSLLLSIIIEYFKRILHYNQLIESILIKLS